MNRKVLYVWSNFIIKILLFLFMMTLPVSLTLSNILLGTAVIIFFATYPFSYRFYGLPDKKNLKTLFISPFMIYLLVFISLFYTVNFTETVKFIEYRAALGFVPLMFFLGFRLSRREFETVVAGLIPGVFLIITYYFLLGIYGLNSGSIGVKDFTFSTLEDYDVPFLAHRTYISFYAFFSLIIVLFIRYIRYKLWFKIIYAFFIIIALFSSESRMMIGILTLFILAYPFFINKRQRLFKTVAIIYSVLAVAVVVPVLLGNYDKVVSRFTEVSNEVDTDALMDEVGYDSRAARWEVALDLIKKRPLTGYGSGAEKEILVKSYDDRGLVWSGLFNLDTHNQYLSFGMENGIPAMIFYASMLIVTFCKSLRQRNSIVMIFVLTCSIMSLLENILNVNWMITVFAFVTSAQLFADPLKRKKFNT